MSRWCDLPSCIRAGGLLSHWGDVPSCGGVQRWSACSTAAACRRRTLIGHPSELAHVALHHAGIIRAQVARVYRALRTALGAGGAGGRATPALVGRVGHIWPSVGWVGPAGSAWRVRGRWTVPDLRENG